MEKCYNISLGKGICKTPAWLISFGNTESPSLCTLNLETRKKHEKSVPIPHLVHLTRIWDGYISLLKGLPTGVWIAQSRGNPGIYSVCYTHLHFIPRPMVKRRDFSNRLRKPINMHQGTLRVSTRNLIHFCENTLSHHREQRMKRLPFSCIVVDCGHVKTSRSQL